MDNRSRIYDEIKKTLMKIKFLSLTIFLMLMVMSAFGQLTKASQSFSEEGLKKRPNTDANTAIEINDSIFGPTNISIGFGMVETKFKNISEGNSAWFKITMKHDTALTFDIVPIDSLDDYDFSIYKVSEADKSLIRLRSCFSVCSSKSGMTGLSKYARRKEISSGPGLAYVSAIPVKESETFYLMVSYSEGYLKGKPKGNNKMPKGFNIYFHNLYPKRKPITLKNVHFETNKSILKKESFKELDKLVLQIQKSHMKIEIQGHTDNVGDNVKNQQLSEERAKAVRDYLISKNVNKNNIFCKGFGSSKPITHNKTKEARMKNRRVEFVILLN